MANFFQLSFLLFMILSIEVYAQDAYIPDVLNLQKKSYQFKVQAGVQSSRTRFDLDENEQAFTNGEGYAQAFGEFEASFGWTQEVQISAGMRFRNNSTSVFDGTQIQEVSNAGVDSFYGKLNYMVPRKNPKWISNFLLSFRQATYSNPIYDPNQPFANMVLGDGENEFRIGYGLYYQFGQLGNGIEAGVYYNTPSNLSSEILYVARVIMSSGKWSFMGGVEGIRSLENDDFSDNPASKPQVYNGNTFLYNSVNREKMSARLGAYYKWSRFWRLNIDYIYDLSGRSTDLTDVVTFGVSYRVDALFKEKQEKKKFKNYNIEAIVERTSSQSNYAIINKGYVQGIERGMPFDFYAYDFKGGNKLLARGVVIKVKSRESVVKIKKWYSGRRELDDGVVARGDLNVK